MTLKEAAKKYVELTIWIRELSSPQLSDIDSADAYRDRLLLNFRRIGEIAQINIGLMNEHLLPLLESTRLLTDEEVETLRHLKDELLNPYTSDHLDIPFLYLVALRLCEDAERKNDNETLIRALDDFVMAAYALLIPVQRIYPFCSSAINCREEGIRAAKRILEFLPPEQLQTLPEGPLREAVLINARYIFSLCAHPLGPDAVKYRDFILPQLRRALSLLDDPVYHKLAPGYDWVHHEFRTLHYLSDLTMGFNRYQFDRERLLELNGYAKRLLHLWESEQEHLHDRNTTETILLVVARCACLAGEITVPAYLKELRSMTKVARTNIYSFDDVVLHATIPNEYIRTMNREKISKTDAETVTRFYRNLIRFLHRMPKYGSLAFLLGELTVLLDEFVEIENGIDFETMCMELLAAVHPPTYVHSLSVADLSTCLAKHLFRKKPELFQNTPGYPDPEAIEEHVWHAAACHDIGKLFIVETIITYGRKLYDREFDWIKSHPEVGAGVLSKHEQTKRYAHVVLGHHKWYDGKGGYPESYHPAETPDRITVDLVTCADCLDAATDSVGRSYKQGKTLDEFIAELKEGSGTRYAPFLPELFEDDAVYRELDTILNAGRDDKYRRTYRTLKEVLR